MPDFRVSIDGAEIPIDYPTLKAANAARRSLRESPDYADCKLEVRRVPYAGASATSLDGRTEKVLDSQAGFLDVLSHWSATGHLPVEY